MPDIPFSNDALSVNYYIQNSADVFLQPRISKRKKTIKVPEKKYFFVTSLEKYLEENPKILKSCIHKDFRYLKEAKNIILFRVGREDCSDVFYLVNSSYFAENPPAEPISEETLYANVSFYTHRGQLTSYLFDAALIATKESALSAMLNIWQIDSVLQEFEYYIREHVTDLLDSQRTIRNSSVKSLSEVIKYFSDVKNSKNLYSGDI